MRSQRAREAINKGMFRLGLDWRLFPPLPEDGRVLFFKRDRDDFGFLSNFHPSPIVLDGRQWPTVEHFYQAQKSHNPAFKDMILEKERPDWAKYRGNSAFTKPRLSKKSWFKDRPEDFREDWDEVKLAVMAQGGLAKFTQNPELARALKATGDAVLIEDSDRDGFWGWGEDQRGANHLGRCLMAIRDAIF